MVFATLLTSLRADEDRWVTTWACAPQLTESKNLPAVPLADRALRQFVRASIGGKRIRVRLSNFFGKDPVTVKAARLARSAGKGSSGDGKIDLASDRALLFAGKSEVVIPARTEILSDPLDFEMPSLGNVAISLAFGGISATTVTGHPGSRTTSFITSTDALSAASLPQAVRAQHWYIIRGIEVAGGTDRGTIVVLGDSLTDGRGSTTDANNRWPDALAKRLQDHQATSGMGVVNMGIGGNAIFGGLGPAALKRFDRDVLNLPGARYFILFEGVNDIGAVHDGDAAGLPEKLTRAYREFAIKAKAAGMGAWCATITPFGAHGYFTPAREECRKAINVWIRNNSEFDGVVDFDAAVRDPERPTHLLPAYSDDGLHLNPAGYQAMADTVDLKHFTP